MTAGTTAPPRYLLGVCYTAGALIVFDQIAQFYLSVSPIRIDEVGWRFGAMGLLAGRTTAFTFGGLLVLVAATLSGHRRTLLALALVHLALAVLLLGGAALFSLDAIQMRRAVVMGDQRALAWGAGRVAVTSLLAAGYAVLVAIIAGRFASGLGGGRDGTTPILLR